MDCAEFLERYSEYDDSLLSPPELDGFRSHMAACESCRRYDRVLRKGRMIARQVPPVEPSDDFVPRLRSRLWQESLRAPVPAEAGAWAAVSVDAAGRVDRAGSSSYSPPGMGLPTDQAVRG